MSRGRLYRPTYKDDEGRTKESRVWWADFSVNGERYRESTKATNRGEAERYLTRRLRELDVYGPQEREYGDVELLDLMELIRRDYERNNRRSNIEYALSHLEDFYGEGFPVVNLGDPQVEAYVQEREGEGAANATINRELSALRRMFNLGERSNLVAPGKAPDVSRHMLNEDNTRRGFVTEAEFQRLREGLPPRLQPLVETAYVTGWRKGELLSRDFEHVDFEHGWLRLEPGETKSGEGRQFPLTATLRAVLEEQWERRGQVEQEYGTEVDALFFYYAPSDNGLPAGRRIKSFRRAWDTARTEAELPDLLFHDLRRSAARNMIRAGVPQSVAQEYTGHETAALFRRYNIVDESSLREQASKLDALREREQEAVRDTNGKDWQSESDKVRNGESA